MSNTSALSEKHELQRSGKQQLATDQKVIISLITLAKEQTGKASCLWNTCFDQKSE